MSSLSSKFLDSFETIGLDAILASSIRFNYPCEHSFSSSLDVFVIR